MFQSSTSLPHLLAPAAYCDPIHFANESSSMLHSAWHLVGTTEQLKKPGDFLTATILGEEIQVRRFEDQIRALSNICAHRHCVLTDKAMGHSKTMRCQYHGWEYGSDGLTRKIPCAKDFAPLNRSQLQLPAFRVDLAGQLIFICLDSNAPSLHDFLGPIASFVNARFSEDWRQFYNDRFVYDANWKIAIENSLEAYHIESIHPQTFRNAPGENRSEHQLGEQHTAFITDMPFAAHHFSDKVFQHCEAWVIRRLGGKPMSKYQQHHVFPNLLFSFTDSISLVHCVHPKTSTQSQSLLFQFGISPERSNFIQRYLSKYFGKLQSFILKQIMKEDVRLYPNIQRGLQASPHRGTLARSEERIHSFQAFMIKSMSDGKARPDKLQPTYSQVPKENES